MHSLANATPAIIQSACCLPPATDHHTHPPIPLTLQLTIDQMLERCSAAINKTRSDLEFLRGMVASYNLTWTTYEAGPSIVENSVLLNGGGTAGAADK